MFLRRAFVIAALLFLAALAAFGSGGQEAEPTAASAPAGPVTLTFYRLSSDAHNRYLVPMIEAFQKKNPNINIQTAESPGSSYESLAEKILLSFASGNPADLGQIGYTLLRTMVDSGRAAALNDLMANDPAFSKDSLFPSMLALGTLHGKTYMLPLGTSTPTMYVNMDLFRSVGLNPENPPKSWDETRAAAVRLKAAGNQGVLWGWSITGNWMFQSMLENAGGSLTSPDGKTITFNSEKGVQVMSYLADLAKNGLMPVTKDTVQTFVSGKLGMLVDSSFQRVNTPAQSPFKVKLAPMPTPTGSYPVVPAGGNGVMMFSPSKDRQQASWQFLRFVSETEAGLIVAETSGYTPANKAAVDELRRKYAGDANYAIVLDQVARVTPWHSWPGQNGTEIYKVILEMQESVLLGKQQPKEALDAAANRVKELLP